MWKRELDNLPFPGIPAAFPLEAIPTLPLENLPIYTEKTHTLHSSTGSLLATFSNEKALSHGSYGNLFLCQRKEGSKEQTILLKQPRLPEMNLFQEGILQSITYLSAEKAKLRCIPKVFDIFWRDQRVWFSMEYIPGLAVLDWFSRSTRPDLDFFLILAQLSLYLYWFETHLGLDHRDLKLDNLLIKVEPCEIQIPFKDHSYSFQCPFTVVLLDFGFACLGSNELRGKPIVNLGDGILPPMDPCPKEGRDIFQLLTSFLRVPHFQQAISPATQKRIDDWLSIGTKSYGPMARRWSTENWTYLVASQRDFAIPLCCPENILRSLLPDLQGYLTKH